MSWKFAHDSDAYKEVGLLNFSVVWSYPPNPRHLETSIFEDGGEDLST